MLKHLNKRAAWIAGLSAIAVAAYAPGDAGALAKSKKRDEAKLEKTPVLPPGPLQIIVSINSQRATLYADGVPVAHSAVSTGTPGHPTPMGVFSVIQKDRHHVSNLYAAAMPYMQRITWSGAALHQGPLPGFPASHGCIRLTGEFAQMLWKVTKLGVRVIVTKPDVAPVEIASSRLFAPKPKIAEAAPKVDAPLVKTADASATVPVARSAETVSAAKTDSKTETSIITETVLPPERPRSTGPISVFVSRLEGKLRVRQGYTPLFEMPVTIKNPTEPLGTHVYTAMALKDGGAALRWNVITIPSAYPRAVKTAKLEGKSRKKEPETKMVADLAPAPSASEALDRLELPQDAVERIDALITPGSSLIVSDNKLSEETDKDTDFIVTTR